MNITAKVIQYSKSILTNKEIITYELEYPRYIHAEFMTHRLFSRNSASSRAIPIDKMHEQIIAANVEFVHYGKNQPGMQAKEELGEGDRTAVKALWIAARDYCIGIARAMNTHQAHKQIANRVTEPWMMMKVVMTTTEDANWDWLRRHGDAQPEIRFLSEVMHEAKAAAIPMLLQPGEWHVPYVHRYRDENTSIIFYGDDGRLSIEDAKIISASCCAQVSYRRNDDSLEKAKAIFDRLINSDPVHASPIEHQATPIDYITVEEFNPCTWEPGITHVDSHSNCGSGNFKDWIQFRQLIPGNSRW